MESIEAHIANHPFWHGMRIEFLPFLAKSARLAQFGVEELVYQDRHEAKELYLVQKGRVALEIFEPDSGVVTTKTIGPGEALGWEWCFPPYQWHTAARSVDATELLVFDAADLRSKAEQSPAFGRDMMLRIAQTLWHDLSAAQQRIEQISPLAGKHNIDDCLKPVDAADLRAMSS